MELIPYKNTRKKEFSTPLCSFLPWKNSPKGYKVLPPDTKSAGALIQDFPVSRVVRNSYDI
jgi:hypothetical protein